MNSHGVCADYMIYLVDVYETKHPTCTWLHGLGTWKNPTFLEQN